MRRKSKSTTLGGLVLAALLSGLLAISSPSAAAQDESEPIDLEPVPSDQVTSVPIADGTYVGSIGLGGAFWLPHPQMTMRWDGRGTGPVEFTVSGGQVTGTWSMNGSANITLLAGPMTGNGTNTWNDSGQIGGSSSGPLLLIGNGGTTSSTVSVQIPNFPAQSQTATDAIPAATIELQRMLDVCGQITASWDHIVGATFDGSGLESSIRTYLTVLPQGRTELQTDIDALLADASELSSALGDPDYAILVMATLSLTAEQILGQLDASQDQECGINAEFQRIVTQHIQDAMNTLLLNWDSYDFSEAAKISLLRRMLQNGLRSGSIGSGAADQSAADHLEGLAAGIAQDAFDVMLSEGAFDSRLADLGMIGQILDLDYVTAEGNQVDPGDLCLLSGEVC